MPAPSPPPPFWEVIPSRPCPELNGRTNLWTVTSVAQPVYCYQLDGSHPAIAAQLGACENYYQTHLLFPGITWPCVYDAASDRCQQSSAWLHCENAPPAHPFPALPPAPPQKCQFP